MPSSWPVRLSGGPRAQGDPKARRQRGTGEIILVVLGAGAETAQSERGKYRGGWLKDELGAQNRMQFRLEGRVVLHALLRGREP
jgi:hypothetical protein